GHARISNSTAAGGLVGRAWEMEGSYRATAAAQGVASTLQPLATNEPTRICQIPRTRKIVYTQGCSFGPGRDNQLSYMTNDGAMARWRMGSQRVFALSRVPWLPSERSETVEMQHIHHTARGGPWRDEM